MIGNTILRAAMLLLILACRTLPAVTPTYTETRTVSPTRTATPLVASLRVVSSVLEPSVIPAGQAFTLVISASNTGVYLLTSVGAGAWSQGGMAGAAIMLTISPQRLDLLPGEAAAFTYIGLAQAGAGSPPWNFRMRPEADGTSSFDGSWILAPVLNSNLAQVIGGATPTFGPSPTRSVSPTRSPSYTSSPTRSPSFTPSPSPSATPTPSPSFSASPSVTPGAPFCAADVYAPGSSQSFYRVMPYPGGGVVMTGHRFQGSNNILLRRYDGAGLAVWTQDADGGMGVSENGVALGVDAAGRSYVSAWAPGGGVVRSYDSAGQLRWSRSGPGSGYADALAVASDGRVAAAFTQSGDQPRFRAYDSDGNQLWERQHPVPGCFAFNVAFDQCGRLWAPLACGTLASFDAAGNTAPSLSIPGDGRDIAVDRQNRLAVATWSGGDSLIQTLDSDGSVAWTRSVADSQPWGIAVDSEGSVYACGDDGGGTGMSPGLRPFVVKYDAQGVHQWTWWGQNARAESVAVTDDGTVWVAAWTSQGQALALRLCQPAPSAPQSLAGCASPTPTKTRTVSATASATRTLTPTRSVTPSLSPTQTPSMTATAVESSPTTTETPAPTAFASPTLSPAPVPGGDPRIQAMVAFPHPSPRWIKIKLSDASGELRFKLYSTSHIQVGAWSEGPATQGWNTLRWPSDLARLAPGHYRLRAQARKDSGDWSEPKAVVVHIYW